MRRKGSSRLAFFSSHFGICEQWELVEQETTEPWSQQRMSFRSRLLPQVDLQDGFGTCAWHSSYIQLSMLDTVYLVSLMLGCVLVQYILTADVQRIGSQAIPQNVFCAVTAAEGDLSEPAELQRVSDLLITEWSQFVAREKKVSLQSPI